MASDDLGFGADIFGCPLLFLSLFAKNRGHCLLGRGVGSSDLEVTGISADINFDDPLVPDCSLEGREGRKVLVIIHPHFTSLKHELRVDTYLKFFNSCMQL